MGKKQANLLAIMIILLIFSSILSLVYGSVKIPFSEIFAILKGEQTTNYIVLMKIRFPRIVFGFLVGINLALSGLLLQTVLKNPLADPGIMGISAGATLGATIILILLPIASIYLPIVSFVSGIIAFIFILVFSWEEKVTPVRLILAGVAINAIAGGAQSFLMTMYRDRIQGVITWLNGDLAGKTWDQVWLTLIYGIPAYALVIFLLPRLNALNLSDDIVYSLGMSPRNYRIISAVIGVYLAAIVVSQTGIISFVGLIVPHLARLIVGGNLKKLLPFTIIIGCIVVVLADFISRIVLSPIEISIGTVMSIIGGPFFLYLLAKDKARKG